MMRYSAACPFVLAGFNWHKRSISAGITDDARALVRKPSKSERLPDLEDVLAVHLVLKQRIPRGVCGRSVRGRQRLKQTENA